MTLSAKREKDHLENFKKIIRDMIVLLRSSLQADTVSLHWINSNREIFVLETYATIHNNVVYEDRVKQDQHFLERYRSIKSVTALEVGVHLSSSDLNHYTSASGIRYIYLIPLISNSETVAITSIESVARATLSQSDEKSIRAFQKAVARLLHTYLEISDLLDKQSEWVQYDEVAARLSDKRSAVEITLSLLNELQMLGGSNSGTLLMARGMDDWHTVLYSEKSHYPPAVGLALQEQSMAAQALQKGEPFFSAHFNANPKRVSVHEPLCHGASLAVPIMMRHRRQLLALVYSENPLMFNDVLRYKMINLCRICGLKLEALLPGLGIDEDLFSSGLMAYSNELFQASLQSILRHENDTLSALSTWVAMVTVGNIADLRTRYRLEELRELQNEILARLRPQHTGSPGLIGLYSDYTYTLIIQSADESAFTRYKNHVERIFKDPVTFASEKSESISLGIGVLAAGKGMMADTVLGKARMAMNESLRQKKLITEA